MALKFYSKIATALAAASLLLACSPAAENTAPSAYQLAPESANRLERIDAANIPVDIVFEQGKAVLGL